VDISIKRYKEKSIWPVPESYSKKLPAQGQPGSFWENRNDRFHCGIDIYAPQNSKVVAIKSGTVLDCGLFTNSSTVHYWNKTYFATIFCSDELIIKYCELGSLAVQSGDTLLAGELIGRVGSVLDASKITEKDPAYIQALKTTGNNSMLHLEVFQKLPVPLDNYLGGNLFDAKRPTHLLNPQKILYQPKIEKEIL
jgi:murein DD-endopeptidase MepM/ murein hydrolase activator NlpD